MRKIKVQPLSVKTFEEFGSFYNLMEPEGHHLGDFYHDHILDPVAGNKVMAFSSLISHKCEHKIIAAVEYHNTTGEIILPLDGAVIVHVAPPSNKPVPEMTEAFLVPVGTMVRLNTGVWHMTPFAVEKEETHIMIGLPERTYFVDCAVINYEEKDQIEVIL